MKRGVSLVAVALLLAPGMALADTFGTGANQFTIRFVPISGATNPTSGYGIVNNDYRMGTYEITNDQWDRFKASLGVAVTGNPAYAYDQSPQWAGTDVPTNHVSWLEAAQFVNWLNTSTGHHEAYRFSGSQGSSDYTFGTWGAVEADNGWNLYRHKDAPYYLPTENEWFKAAYWNGVSMQTWATKAGQSLFLGNGSNGGWNYGPNGLVEGAQPWNVGSGSQELNGTYDMMGNVWEWTESPFSDTDYGTNAYRAMRGGSYGTYPSYLSSLDRDNNYGNYPWVEHVDGSFGFRIASDVPEPFTFSLLALGGLAVMRRRMA